MLQGHCHMVRPGGSLCEISFGSHTVYCQGSSYPGKGYSLRGGEMAQSARGKHVARSLDPKHACGEADCGGNASISSPSAVELEEGGSMELPGRFLFLNG